jgi:pyruvate,water dikinase
VARYLVELGIDSISLTPDRVLQTMKVVQEIEVALGRPARATPLAA